MITDCFMTSLSAFGSVRVILAIVPEYDMQVSKISKKFCKYRRGYWQSYNINFKNNIEHVFYGCKNV